MDPRIRILLGILILVWSIAIPDIIFAEINEDRFKERREGTTKADGRRLHSNSRTGAALNPSSTRIELASSVVCAHRNDCLSGWVTGMPHLPRDLAPALCEPPTQTLYFRPYIMQERSDYRYTRYDIILRKGLQAHGWTPLVVLYETSMILFLYGGKNIWTEEVICFDFRER